MAVALIAASVLGWNQSMVTDLLRTLDKVYGLPNGGWREEVGKDDRVFLWGYSVLLSAYAKGARVSKDYIPLHASMLSGLAGYLVRHNPPAPVPAFKWDGGGYSVLPNGSVDRYYDDNAWIGIAALESTERHPLMEDVTRRCFDMVASGEDAKLGGGIYWHEGHLESKNACVAGPGAHLAFLLYDETKEDRYRKAGERWTAWLENLVDKDGLVMDNMRMDGSIDRAKYSYNTALYILDLLHLYKLHPTPSLRAKIVRSSRAAWAQWFDPTTFSIKGPGMFAMHLVEAWKAVEDEFGSLSPGDSSYTGKCRTAIQLIYQRFRQPDGTFGEHWDRPPKPGEARKLMYAASVLRTLLILGHAEG